MPVTSSITDFLSTPRTGGKRVDLTLTYVRKTGLHPNGAEMVRKLVPQGGDKQEPNRPVYN